MDPEPQYVQIVSEPYVVFTRRGYQPVVDVVPRKSKKPLPMRISATSLSNQLEIMRNENEGIFMGLEFWIRKASYERTSLYILEES